MFRVKLEYAIVLAGNGVYEELINLGGGHAVVVEGKTTSFNFNPSPCPCCFIRSAPETIGQHILFMKFTFRPLTISVQLLPVCSDPRTVSWSSV